MSNLLENLLAPSNFRSRAFPDTSRYSGLEIATFKTAEGREVNYTRRRFIPQPEELSLLHEHTVAPDERLDLIAGNYLKDPEQFWRICDANRAMHPRDLERHGRTLRITLPDGFPGDSGA